MPGSKKRDFILCTYVHMYIHICDLLTVIGVIEMLKNYKHQKKELQQPVSFVNIFLILISHRNIFPLKVLEK